MHDGGYDIGAARRAVEGQTQSHAAAAEDGTDEAGHERLVLEQVQATGIAARKSRQSREHDDGIDGLHAETPAENLQRQRQQEGVDDEVGRLHRYACTPVEDGGDTRHTARGDIVGQQKDGPADTVADHGDGNHHIVTDLCRHFIVQFHRC